MARLRTPGPAALAVALLTGCGGLAGCGGGPVGRTSTPPSVCRRLLSIPEARAVLGAAVVRLATPTTGSTGHLDPGGVICEYGGYTGPAATGQPSSLFLIDAWYRQAGARRIYADYVKGLSGTTRPVAGLGDAAVSAPDIYVVRRGDSVVVVGTTDRTLAGRVAARL